MKCDKCGKEVQKTSKFCASCGRKLESSMSNESIQKDNSEVDIINGKNVTDGIKDNTHKKKRVQAGSKQIKVIHHKKGLSLVMKVTSVLGIAAIAVVFFLFKPIKGNDYSVESEVKTEETITDNADKSSKNGIERVLGYWTSKDYTVNLTKNRLYIQELETSDFEEYAYTYGREDDVSLSLTLDLIKDNNDDSQIFSMDEVLYVVTLDEELKLSQMSDHSNEIQLMPTNEENMDEAFLGLVRGEPEEIVSTGIEEEEDYTFADFVGYWFPFDTYDMDEYSMGNYGFYIGESHTIFAYMESEGISSEVRDHSIEGNTLSFWEYDLDGFALMDLEYDPTAVIEREVRESRVTLFKEENDRDRLVFHKSGLVLQKVTEEEIITTPLRADYDESYPLFAENHIERLNELSLQYNQLSPDQLIENKHSLEEDQVTVNLENYPYSLGNLSEEQLKKEYEIINGVVPNPETIDEDAAISQLLNGAFETTPSYEWITHVDRGYYFNINEFGSDFIGFVTLGGGGRTKWSSMPANGDISRIEFVDHIYTVFYSEDSMMPTPSERFYRIDENIIYAEDSEGEFTMRLEKDTNWDDFQGLPERPMTE